MNPNLQHLHAYPFVFHSLSKRSNLPGMRYGFVTVLPGSYPARQNDGFKPGKNHVRIALVAELADCIDATEAIRETLKSV